jgi:hypothetical protein
VHAGCKLDDAEQARLGMYEAFCGGPCAPDDTEDTAILESVFDGLKTCVDLHRMIMWIQNVSTFGYLTRDPTYDESIGCGRPSRYSKPPPRFMSRCFLTAVSG